MNNLLNKLSNLDKVTPDSVVRTPMTDEQIEQCKTAIRRDSRGYNVQPNRFDITVPYRVAINYNDKWNNFGNFKSADVAAAVGTIVSAGYFGEKAKAGSYIEANVTDNPEFTEWMNDERNLDIITRASGDLAPIHSSMASTLADDEIVF